MRTTSDTELLDEDLTLEDAGTDMLLADELRTDELALDDDKLELTAELVARTELDAAELESAVLESDELITRLLELRIELMELRTELEDAALETGSRLGYAFLTNNWNASGNQRPATGALARAPVPRLELLPSVKVYVGSHMRSKPLAGSSGSNDNSRDDAPSDSPGGFTQT